MTISMTKVAKSHIKKQIKCRENTLGIRVGVRTAGCSGLSYILEFVNQFEESDYVFNQGDFSLVVDQKSFIYLDGTELDFVQEGLNEGFDFKNPNAKNKCGCGESFHV